MDKLVTCPKCGGTGEIKLPEPKTQNKSKLDDNVANFAKYFGAKEKPKQTYRTCPNCNGFGLVRG